MSISQAPLIKAHAMFHRILEAESIDLPGNYTKEELLEELRRTFTQREVDFDELPSLTQEAIVDDAKDWLAETYGWTCQDDEKEIAFESERDTQAREEIDLERGD